MQQHPTEFISCSQYCNAAQIIFWNLKERTYPSTTVSFTMSKKKLDIEENKVVEKENASGNSLVWESIVLEQVFT